MILVTVGSTPFPFRRMARFVEHLASIRSSREKIIFQYGHTPPKGILAQTELHPFMSHEKLMDHMKRARVIICHGGPATIYQALSLGKIPWALPRQKQFGEHVDDHQVYFCRFMKTKHLVNIIEPTTCTADISKTTRATTPIRGNNTALVVYLTSLVAHERS